MCARACEHACVRARMCVCLRVRVRLRACACVGGWAGAWVSVLN